jgi:cytochrome P450
MFRNDDFRRNSSLVALAPRWFSPRIAAALVAAIATAAVVSWVIPELHPALAVAIAVVVGAAIVARTWTGSAGLRLRHLPPGRLTRLFTTQLDIDHFQRSWRRHGPVFTTSMMYRPTVAVGGLERGARVLRDNGDSLQAVSFDHTAWVASGSIRTQSGERHRASRAAFSRALAPASVEPSRAELHAILDRHIAGWPRTEPYDVAGLRGVVDDAILDAFVLLLWGVTANDDPSRHAAIRSYALGYDYHGPDARIHDPSVVLDHMAEHADDRGARLHPSCLRGLAERVPDALGDPVITTNVAHLMHTARHDMAGLCTWLVHDLASFPEWVGRVRDGERGRESSWVVSETLRRWQSEFVLRVATGPVRVDGHEIPEGWWLRVLVRESHRDPDVFDDPDGFDPTRFRGGAPPRDAYAPFGLDAHSCVGEAFTRLLATTFVETLCARADLAALGDGAPSFNAHFHWEPSRAFQVRISTAPA